MEPTTTFLLVSTGADDVARVRDALTEAGAHAWTSGPVVAARGTTTEVIEILNEHGAVVELKAYEREIPAAVLAKLPPGARLMVETHRAPTPRKAPSASAGLAWDTPGFEAPRVVRKGER